MGCMKYSRKGHNSMKWYEYALAAAVGGVLFAGLLYNAKLFVDINNSRIEERTRNTEVERHVPNGSLERVFEERIF